MRSLRQTETGLTIIELLVTITIITILAVTILAALSDARQQGIDAKITTEMDAIAKRAGIEESQSFTFDIVCGSNGVPQSPAIADIIIAVNSFASSTVTCNSGTSAYAVSVPLGSAHWCVDSAGNKTEIPAPLTTTPVQLSCL